MVAVARNDRIDATNTELWAVYNVLRSAYLNVLYYGRMGSRRAVLNQRLQIVAAVGSLSSVSGFLTAQTSVAGDYAFWWRLVAALVGAGSGICAALPQLMGLSEKIARCERLHFAYCELFQLAQRTVMDVRREGIITTDQAGAAKLLSDMYSRLGQADECGFDKKLRDQCEAEVREKYPKDSLWYADEDVKGPRTPVTPPIRA